MLEGKALIQDTDMPVKMQVQAMACASQALDLYDVLDCRSIAAHIKKVSSFFLFFLLFSFLCNIKSLTRDMGVDGNVWWVHSLGVSSHIQKGLSYISHWRLSSFSSSKVLLHLPITDGSKLNQRSVWLQTFC
ncbi:hypothetical protein JRO89_XS09G0168500 [Xanthoceras sorbifolium]|uniref:Dynein light chain n=1 Tax=Xanthoceras sorbifolium TaxID=99658 RepID=A0ABQ8HLU1_9ROSI|nr:hypothetical protein JRO89_XS09G0168500 [Xanthoceras sorbifolium]